jgi:hypothetical protein
MSMEKEASVVDAPRTLSAQQQALVRTLLYFDIFQHPLRRDELERFSGAPAGDLDADLGMLCGIGIVQRKDDLFSLAPIDPMISSRREQEQRAERRMTKARRMSRLIGSFPFVRGVMLSGSISKGVLAEDGDIDYFIITQPGRLWVARTLLVLYKKVFLLNSRRDFCVNYFIDSDHLAIEDRNVFTATEIVTLIPTHGPLWCSAFFAANEWAFDSFPNLRREPGLPATSLSGRRRTPIERLFAGSLGDRMDDLFMRLTFKRWRRKFGHMDAQTFEQAFRTRKYVSKHHPRSFQKRVLSALDDRMHRFALEHGLALN